MITNPRFKRLTKTQRLRTEQELIEVAARLSAAAHYAERIAECLALHEIGEHVAESHRASLVENINDTREALSRIRILQEITPLEARHD